jgi:magnesium-transporting ATPase (P-type)
MSLIHAFHNDISPTLCHPLTQLDEPAAQTLAFLAWLLGHVLLALNMRTFQQPLLLKGVFSNPGMVVWCAAAFILAAACVLLRPLANILKLARLDMRSVGVVIVSTLVLTFWVEAGKLLRWVRQEHDGRKEVEPDEPEVLRQQLLPD